MLIERVGKLHMSGHVGRKRWRVRYWVRGEDSERFHVLGPAEGPKKLSQREASRILSRWQQEVGAKPGLALQETLPTLSGQLDHYLAHDGRRCTRDVQRLIAQAWSTFVDHIGTDRRRVDAITANEAKTYLAYLQSRGYAEATIRTYLSNVKAVIWQARRRFPDHMLRDPFAGITIRPLPTAGVWRYVSRERANQMMQACDHGRASDAVGWRALIALCRFAGCRVSEARRVEKSAVDLTADPPRIKVPAIKTARQSGQRYRVVPILFPELLDAIITAMSDTSPAWPYVVGPDVAQGREVNRTLSRIAVRAGVDSDYETGKLPPRWGFQTLRACCDRDFLNLGLSEHHYSRAMGHSPSVARAYYLAKFEDAVLAEDDDAAFRAAARRVGEAGAGKMSEIERVQPR